LLKTVAVAVALLAATGQTVKKLGNAIVEFRDPSAQAMIAYEYSNRFHSDKWLMIDAAIRTKDHLKFDRTAFTLTMPDETSIPLATQERFLEDAKTITAIRQNSRVWVRNLAFYFVDKQSAAFQLFALPGDGVVTSDIVTYTYGPALVTLFFESPDQQWKEGSYRLTIDNGRTRAVLPVELK
jgi:hypothetical protein